MPFIESELSLVCRDQLRRAEDEGVRLSLHGRAEGGLSHRAHAQVYGL
jgi:hypothetical protein